MHLFFFNAIETRFVTAQNKIKKNAQCFDGISHYCELLKKCYIDAMECVVKNEHLLLCHNSNCFY